MRIFAARFYQRILTGRLRPHPFPGGARNHDGCHAVATPNSSSTSQPCSLWNSTARHGGPAAGLDCRERALQVCFHCGPESRHKSASSCVQELQPVSYNNLKNQLPLQSSPAHSTHPTLNSIWEEVRRTRRTCSKPLAAPSNAPYRKQP